MAWDGQHTPRERQANSDSPARSCGNTLRTRNVVHNDSWKDPELSGLRTGCWELVTGSSSGVRHHLTAKRVIRKGKSSCRDCGSFVKMRLEKYLPQTPWRSCAGCERDWRF